MIPSAKAGGRVDGEGGVVVGVEVSRGVPVITDDLS